MIRPLAMTLGFVGSTLALLWLVGGGDDDTVTPDQVSRAVPDVMGLQPALTAAPDISSQNISPLIRPEARPGTLTPPSAPTPVPDQSARVAPAIQASPDQKVNGAIEAMGYGILKELKKPVQPRAEAPVETARAAPEPQAAPKALTRTYTVQPGDSLPGIAFRIFGTTVAYLQILEANQDQLRSPTDLRAGMVLRIPE